MDKLLFRNCPDCGFGEVDLQEKFNDYRVTCPNCGLFIGDANELESARLNWNRYSLLVQKHTIDNQIMEMFKN